MIAQEISIFIWGAVLFVAMFCFVAFVRSIARAEVNKAIKSYIVGQVLRPRNHKGQFR
jgi:hypothetical protein